MSLFFVEQKFHGNSTIIVILKTVKLKIPTDIIKKHFSFSNKLMYIGICILIISSINFDSIHQMV